jgi:hypothetical protein
MTNHHTALATLERTERTLKKDDQWAKTYKNQMDDMVDRCVARKLAIIRRSKELDWPGVLYLPFSSCKSAFQFYARKNCVQLQPNAQRCFIKCLSRKRSRQLHEQPGWYSSTLERETVTLIGDIRKMFNSVYLKALEQHCHRFLWRDLQQHRPPDIYVIQRVTSPRHQHRSCLQDRGIVSRG